MFNYIVNGSRSSAIRAASVPLDVNVSTTVLLAGFTRKAISKPGLGMAPK